MSSDFLNWIKNKSEGLGLKISVDKNFSEALPGRFAARASLNFRDRQVYGFGYGLLEHQAVTVAAAETIERCCLIAYDKNARSSNGFAVHETVLEAERGAVFELLERDAILAHHLTETPFAWINYRHFPLSDSTLVNALENIASTLRIRTSIGMMNTVGPGFGAAVVMDGSKAERQFGIIFAASYGLSFEGAIEKALREAFASLAARETLNLWETLDEASFLALPMPKPSDHGNYALYPDKEGWIEKMFRIEPAWQSTQKLSTPSIKTERLNMPREFWGIPLVACRASSAELQDLYFGRNSSHKLNIERLSQFAGHTVDIKKIEEMIPHFLD